MNEFLPVKFWFVSCLGRQGEREGSLGVIYRPNGGSSRMAPSGGDSF